MFACLKKSIITAKHLCSTWHSLFRVEILLGLSWTSCFFGVLWMWIEGSVGGNFLLEGQVLERKGVVLDRSTINNLLPHLWRLWSAQGIRQKTASLGSNVRKNDKIFCVAMKTFLCLCGAFYFYFYFPFHSSSEIIRVRVDIVCCLVFGVLCCCSCTPKCNIYCCTWRDWKETSDEGCVVVSISFFSFLYCICCCVFMC